MHLLKNSDSKYSVAFAKIIFNMNVSSSLSTMRE
jgi:hypothetical protein